MSLRVRDAGPEDDALLLRFILELADYERAIEEVKTDAAGIRASLFGAAASARALICELNGDAVGYAVYFFNYSTWLGRKGLYLEDVYVTPEQRGKGAGKALLRHLAKLALLNGCGRFEWSVLDWNRPAIEFYEALGAKPQDEWTTFRLTGEALRRLAEA